MVDRDLGADVDHVVFRHAEFRELRLGLDGGGGEMAAQRLRRVLDLGKAHAELDGSIAVLLFRELGHDLAVLHQENGDGHMLACIIVDAGHAQLLCDNT